MSPWLLSVVVSLTVGFGPAIVPCEPDPSDTPTPTPTATAAPTPTATPAPTATATPAPTATATPAPTATATPAPTPTATPAPTPTATPATTPVGINGALHVCGIRLCNRFGQQVQLRGMSTHGIQWYASCVNRTSLDVLAKDWRADVLRVAMYVQEDGYASDPAKFTELVDDYIDLATERGLYVIVDWHILDPGDPAANVSRARTFFNEIASRHRTADNIIYEIANEPSGVSWSRVRSYAEEMIPVIRAQDPDAVVLVGTRAWSSLGVSEDADETEIVDDPVRAANVMYTFHFYAASHGAIYMDALSRAADKLPMFVSEFGTQTYTGDGGNDFARSQRYLDLMASKGISWTNWNWSDDGRSGAVFEEGTCRAGSYADPAQLKPAGTWVRDRIRSGRIASSAPVAPAPA